MSSRTLQDIINEFIATLPNKDDETALPYLPEKWHETMNPTQLALFNEYVEKYLTSKGVTKHWKLHRFKRKKQFHNRDIGEAKASFERKINFTIIRDDDDQKNEQFQALAHMSTDDPDDVSNKDWGKKWDSDYWPRLENAGWIFSWLEDFGKAEYSHPNLPKQKRFYKTRLYQDWGSVANLIELQRNVLDYAQENALIAGSNVKNMSWHGDSSTANSIRKAKAEREIGESKVHDDEGDDEDYMTKNAQQALRYVIQKYSHNVRFCLICNYISRIDDSLQNEFIRLRFCQLPKKDILLFLDNIVKSENLNVSKKQLEYIQILYKSDIRSMINYIQINYNDFFKTNIEQFITDELYEEIIKCIKKGKIVQTKNFINDININYNISKINLIKNFLKYLIKTKTYVMKEKWINVFKFIFHNDTSTDSDVLYYAIYTLTELYKSL